MTNPRGVRRATVPALRSPHRDGRGVMFAHGGFRDAIAAPS